MDYRNCLSEIWLVLHPRVAFVTSVQNYLALYLIKRDFFYKISESCIEHIVSFNQFTLRILLERNGLYAVSLGDFVGRWKRKYLLAVCRKKLKEIWD